MSQIYKNSASGPPPPGSLTDLTGDTGTNPVPPDGANNINLFEDPLAPGVITRGDAASNTVFFGLQIPQTCGTGVTVDVATADLVTLPLGATPGTYTFEGIIAGKAATASGIGGTVTGTFRTNGAAATIINTVDQIVNKDLAIAGASFDLIASANNVIFRARGSLGAVITWKGCISLVLSTAGV